MTGCASMCCAGSASGRSAPAGSAARSGAACARRESGLARIDRRRAHRDAVEVLVFGPHALALVVVVPAAVHGAAPVTRRAVTPRLVRALVARAVTVRALQRPIRG